MTIELKPISHNSGAYEAGTKFASDTTLTPGENTPEVSVVKSVLPAGAATQTTAAALLTELEKKADLTETQPVDLAAHAYTGTLGALNAVLNITCEGHAGTMVFQVSGTWQGKIVVEGAVDGVYANLSIVQPGGAISFTGVNNDNQNGVYRALIIAGYTNLRLRMSSYTSGTATVVANTAQLIPTAYVWQLNQANLLATAYQGGTWTVQPGNTANTTAWKVDGSAVTQPVSDAGGSLTVDNAGTFAVQATQAGTWAVNGYDFGTQVARGLVAGFSRINKFGAAPDGVQTTATDIWSRADATPTQQIWLAPTAARQHAIVSTSVNDDGDPVGTGARTIRVYGLQTWASAESSEDITLNGTGAVNTVNSYVIIHRMKVLTMGTAGPNVGTISATAATDGTITAIIAPGDGQTEMAIYGVPSGYTFYLKRWGASIGKGNTTVSANFKLLVNESPSVQTTAYLRKDDINLVSTGTSGISRVYDIPPSFPGPCIIKVQAVASAVDTDATSGFDAYIVAN